MSGAEAKVIRAEPEVRGAGAMIHQKARIGKGYVPWSTHDAPVPGWERGHAAGADREPASAVEPIVAHGLVPGA